MCDKRELRTRFKALRKELQDPEKDLSIARHALEAFAAKSCFCYLSFGTEAGTSALIEGLRARGSLVCAPKVSGKDMLSLPLQGGLEKGAFGISEPVGGEDTVCELAFAPLLAVDSEGYRLGYGGGFYDRYFSRHPSIYRVGIGYAGQRTERLPREETDIPLDALVTELGVTYFGSSRQREK